MATESVTPEHKRLRNAGIGAILIPFFSVFLFPFFIMISTSLKNEREVFQQPPTLIPRDVDFSNYRVIWEQVTLALYFRNSLIIGIGTALLALLLAIPAAYALARFDFAARRLYMYALLVIQMFSPIIIIIALFQVVSSYGLIDKLGTLIVINTAFGLSYAVWMLSGYFESIPAEIEEAAMMDGVTRFRAIAAVTIPLSWPGIVAAAIFTFMNAWNEFLFALTFVFDENKIPVTVGLFHFVGHFKIEWNLLMAASLVTTAIVLALFLSVQKYLTRGLLGGGLK